MRVPAVGAAHFEGAYFQAQEIGAIESPLVTLRRQFGVSLKIAHIRTLALYRAVLG
jgi:hypothetical protein